MPVLKMQKGVRSRGEDNGYTLIEMIFVILITSILASISVPSLINWKHFQTIKTRQLALKAYLEQNKSDAKRWGATCKVSGADLKNSCASAVVQKRITDTFDLQSFQKSRLIQLQKIEIRKTCLSRQTSRQSPFHHGDLYILTH